MRIAVCTDFSEPSRAAFTAAASLARTFGAELEVVHHAQPTLLQAAIRVDELYASLEAKLAELVAAESCFAGLDVRPVLVRGGNARAFARALAKRAADLLVLARHGRTGLAHFLMGSFAERAARLAPCPVLVCRESEAPASGFALKTLIVAYDFSAHARLAADLAHQWALAAGASLRLLHVIDSECGVTGFEVELFDNWAEYYQKKQQDALAELEALAAHWPDVPVAVEATIGHPALEVMARADAHSADLIVMGSHGASPLEPAHLGSVAEKVMRNALRPVLIVRDRATPAAPR